MQKPKIPRNGRTDHPLCKSGTADGEACATYEQRLAVVWVFEVAQGAVAACTRCYAAVVGRVRTERRSLRGVFVST